MGQLEHGDHAGDKEQLANLDADIEAQQRGGNRRPWQAHFSQRTGETEPVQQAEGECDDPRVSFGEARMAASAVNVLRCLRP